MLEFTAAEIAKLAFNGAIEAETDAGSIAKEKQLWQKIREKFQGNPIAETALHNAQQERSLEILKQEIVPLLQIMMRHDLQFASEIQALAQQIIQVIKNNTNDRSNITIEKVLAKDRGTALAKGAPSVTGSIEVEGGVSSIAFTDINFNIVTSSIVFI